MKAPLARAMPNCSPRMRGWTLQSGAVHGLGGMLPAPAGMAPARRSTLRPPPMQKHADHYPDREARTEPPPHAQETAHHHIGHHSTGGPIPVCAGSS